MHNNFIKGFWNQIPFWRRLVFLLVISFYGIFHILDFAFPFKPQIEYSQVILAKDGSIMHAYLNQDDKWRIKTNLEEITPELKQTIIFKEDRFFRYHFGVNPVAIAKALVRNIFRGEVVSGASTISMQVARMLEPKKRTYWHKIKEIFRAMQLERRYSKNEILQMYLNLVPYGGNIEGIKSAALLFLEQKPEALSLAQIVMLSIIPNNPNTYKPGDNNSLLLEKRNEWLQYFGKKELFKEQDILAALDEDIDCYRHEAPKLAPHLSYRLKSSFPNDIFIQSVVDLNKQSKVENITYNYIKHIRNRNIGNASVLLINNETKEVEAYVGSADFWDNQYQGQVDGIRAIRSPGSALKPFLYAMAFDKGIICPKTVVTDVPINYDGYRPSNYDGKYNGLISIEKALASSLNVPAIKVLDELETNDFVELLGRSGFKRIKQDKSKLGLSLILGGCGVTLEELVNAYSTLANGGIYSGLKYIRSEEALYQDSIYSAGSSYMTSEILATLIRPDLPNKFENSVHLPKIAWKTGTSYGRRDAWAIGYNTKYTIGVWVGNFSGIGIPELNGAEFAVPLLFNVFNSIDYDEGKKWFKKPESLGERLVCSVSGLPPNEFCDDQVIDYYLPGISNNSKCMHQIEVFTDANEDFSFCRSCKPKAGYKKKIYPNYASDLLSFYEDEEIPYEKIPTHNPRCERIYHDNAPAIISITQGMEYLLFKNESNKLQLRCSVENGVEHVYWYVNNKLLQKAKATEKLFFEPKEGENKISCVDDKGRNTDIWVKVGFI
ncbi:MAG: penicillin-binding protein 1C [Bacteroidetes bacterium]|nr:penicillin-binding protein 1C [Bacteroidota bacterium]